MPVRDRARGLALVAAALLLPLTATADISDRLQLAAAVAPERLRLRVQAAALTEGTLPPWAIAWMRRDMERQGYYAEELSGAVVDMDVLVAPALSWDENINGGVVQDRFVTGGLIFEADPGVRAVSGAVASVQSLARARIAYGTGRLIELRSGVDLGYAPDPGLGRADAQLGICSQNHVVDWTFLDVCGLKTYYWRDLVEGGTEEVSVEASQIFLTGASAHQLSARLLRVSAAAGHQGRFAISADSIWTRIATRGELTFGEDLLGQTSLRYRVQGGVSWLMLNRTFSLDLSRQVLDGGAFLGLPRRDQVHGLAISADLRPGVELRVALIDSESTAAVAEYRQVTMDLRFSGFQ